MDLLWDEARTDLLEHRIDAAVARLLPRTDGLDVTILYDEFRVLLVPRDHRLAGKESVSIDDIVDKIEIIAAGQAAAIVSAGMDAESLHPNLTTVPLRGVEPIHVLLATRAGDGGRLVAAFRKCARDHLRSGTPR